MSELIESKIYNLYIAGLYECLNQFKCYDIDFEIRKS